MPLKVVFDLDGVLARRDTMAELIRRQLTSNPARAVIAILPAAAWTVLRKSPGFRVLMSRVLGRIALSGLSDEQYCDLAGRTGCALGADPAWLIADGIAALRGHLSAGDDVVVTTGSEERLSRAFLSAAGLPDVALIATHLRFGRLAHYANHNLGPRKVPNLQGRVVDLFYTDSALDLDVARVATRTILVNPNARLERQFRSEVADLSVARWS